MHPIYLDHNATTPIADAVRAAMLPYLGAQFGNPSSAHPLGVAAAGAVFRARSQVAALIAAQPDEIVFTSGGTEANNLALFGLLRARGVRGAHVVASAIEHPAVLAPLETLATEGLELTLVRPRSDGVLDPDAVDAACRTSTVLVSVMHANNEIGTLQPVAEIARRAHARGILVHTDAAQSVGKVPVDVGELGVDLLSIAGHKLYAPKGIGSLWVRRGTVLTPLMYGGGQERGVRPGTEPVPGIVGLGAACALAAREQGEVAQRVQSLRDHFERALTDALGTVTVNGASAPRLPGTCHVSFLDCDGTDLLAAVPQIMASTGSACHAGHTEPSHVLQAIGADAATARGAVRFSFGRGNGEADVDLAVSLIIAAVRGLLATPPTTTSR